MSFLLLLLFIFLIIPLTIVLNIVFRLFGFFRQTKRTFNNFESEYKDPSQKQKKSYRDSKQKEKIITRDEGEYVDFEEVR